MLHVPVDVTQRRFMIMPCDVLMVRFSCLVHVRVRVHILLHHVYVHATSWSRVTMCLRRVMFTLTLTVTLKFTFMFMLMFMFMSMFTFFNKVAMSVHAISTYVNMRPLTCACARGRLGVS